MERFTRLAGVAAPLPMINIDTDMIIPKQFLKTTGRTGLGKHLFDEMRYTADGREIEGFVLNKPAYRGASILVAGENFGCGSSREHAPWALADFGIRCIIAPSFADIFHGNCFKNGILPIRLPKDQVERLLDDAARGADAVVAVDLENQTVTGPDGVVLPFDVDPFRKLCLLNGLDDIALTLQAEDRIDRYEEARHLEFPWESSMPPHSATTPRGAGLYDQLHARSLADPEGFWGEAAGAVSWSKPWDRVLDDGRAPFSRWFVGGEMNTCHNAVDRHVEDGRGDQAAIIHDSPVTGSVQTLTYAELLDQVSRFAGLLRVQGVEKGDRVLLYMPMIPQSVVAMLACARLGAVHSVVFGGFAPSELATRIDDAKPKIIVSASCGIEPNRVVKYKPMLDGAIEQAAHKPSGVIVFQRPQGTADLVAGRDLDWAEAVRTAEPADCVPVAATDPLYILYTSGTTGQPKGVVRDNGGHAVALCWTMRNLYDIRPGEVFWTASDVGWVVGHSYIVYAPLLIGATTLLFEGKPVGTPDPGTFWRVIEQHKVVTLFTAPTAFRAIKREDPEARHLRKHDLSSLRALFLAGERSDPDTLLWAESNLKVPVIDHWWQTETGWAISGNPLGVHRFPVKHGSATRPMPGWDLRVLDAGQREVPRGDIGAICAKLPLPPGTLPTLWNADERFEKSYLADYPGHYQTGDAGFIDGDGYVHVMARTDDIINVAGHRLSTGGMEEVLASHKDVAECAVIGVADDLKGQVPLGLVCLKAGVDRPHGDIVREVVQLVRERIGPVADFKRAVVVDRLPKTRSGKILRGTMQKIADGQDHKVPATIDDPGILPEIAEALRSLGYARAIRD